MPGFRKSLNNCRIRSRALDSLPLSYGLGNAKEVVGIDVKQRAYGANVLSRDRRPAAFPFFVPVQPNLERIGRLLLSLEARHDARRHQALGHFGAKLYWCSCSTHGTNCPCGSQNGHRNHRRVLTRQIVGCRLPHMRTIDDVFKQWETLTAMAVDVERTRAAVEKWRERQSIPSDAWTALIQALRRKGKELTSDQLLAMHERARRSA
jgi:hypothetical protein